MWLQTSRGLATADWLPTTSIMNNLVPVIVILVIGSKMSLRMLSTCHMTLHCWKCIYRFQVVFKSSKRWQSKAPVRHFIGKMQFSTQQISSADRPGVCAISKKLLPAVFGIRVVFNRVWKSDSSIIMSVFSKVIRYQYMFCTSSCGTQHFVTFSWPYLQSSSSCCGIRHCGPHRRNWHLLLLR